MIRQILNLAIGWTLLLPLTLAVAANVDEAQPGEATERHLTDDVDFTQWVQDTERVEDEAGDTLAQREALADALETIKLSNLVPPIYFASGVAQIPQSTIESLEEILARMDDRINVRLHLVGHADNEPLSPALEEVYGDNFGLSRERAGQVAEHLQTMLALPAEAVSFEWMGESRPVAPNETEQGRALNRRVDVEVWYDEVVEKVRLEEFLVPHEIERVKVCRMETVCKLRYMDGHSRRARVQNLVAPLHYAADRIDVDARFVEQVSQAFDNLADKGNVVVRFTGYADDRRLDGRMARIYGDATGLSKARARRVALAVQDALGLPTAKIASDGFGSTRPIGSNETPQGRALNRRVEVEFWYDDPLQELPDEPQLCPEAAGAVTVTRVYDPPWGPLPDIAFDDGQPVIPDSYAAALARALGEVADKTNPRLRFVGYTRNERLQRRTASVYDDDIGLSASRARRVMERIAAELGINEKQAEFEGRGYVHSDDVINAGFVQGQTSHVAVQVVYEELAVLDDYEGVDVTRLTREIRPRNALALNMMRITVDGEPIDDPGRSSSDIQRCTDVALEKAEIRFAYDNLRSQPRLSATASPQQIRMMRIEDFGMLVAPIRFRMHTNYAHFIERAEVRIFENEQSPEVEPLDVIPFDDAHAAKWEPNAAWFRGPVKEMAYVVRAYGSDGKFDETRPKPLWIVYDDVTDLDADPIDVEPGAEPETGPEPDDNLLRAYGESNLAMHNIGLSSGTVQVRGSGIAEDQQVWVAGRQIPVDGSGRFVSEEILPQGLHTVEVAVVDEDGAGNLYLRDLEFRERDWFYVGMADLTLSEGKATGPMELLQGTSAPSAYDSNIDGRLAFFVNGKFADHWKVTASADTREGPIDDLFSNFMDRSPQALFRRIDQDYYYPTFGDDSTVEQMAPTMGKFFVRINNNDNYGQWGNFKISYMNNELAQVDRGLYGANLHYQSQTTTSFGEQRYTLDIFGAEPGTLAAREEFRGTGGSLYFLHRQDILAGSDRLRIELRDKATGLVTGVVNLTPGIDYDIDYLQGRVLLTEPLASTADDNLLVRSDSNSGNEAYLVVRYEYTPGFNDVDTLSVGGEGHAWIGDHVRLGVTSNVNEVDAGDTSLEGADLTFRYAARTWIKVQQAESQGIVALPQISADGGFEFTTYDPAVFDNVSATADRADVSFSSREVFGFADAQLTVYRQDADAGFAGSGAATVTDTVTYGGTFSLPLADKFILGTKLDNRVQVQGLETRSQEYNFSYQLTDHWDLNAGYRLDERIDRSPVVVLTQEQGERADAILQVGYDSKRTWNAYGFVQDTVSADGSRQNNARTGLGGSYRFGENLRIDAEISDGDLGPGGRLGTSYLHSERTSVYLNYARDTERNISNPSAGSGAQGNLVAGVKSRLADSTSVFLEERYQHSGSMTGLTHGTGITFAPSQRWSLGINSDIGTLRDLQTGAETERLAGGLQLGFSTERLQLGSGVEYRSDDVEQSDLSRTERRTWLFRNNFKYQLNQGARLLGKFNHSESESSLGTFYDGGFTEAVLGFAYRPVTNDRLNTLVKYTYFYNMPTTDQVTLQNIAAEFIQKSHVVSVDIDYDVTRRFTLGAKHAYRLGKISLDREASTFFENPASLYVLRADYDFRDNWEFLVEGRVLDMQDLDESRAGALAAVSRYFGDHLKVGLGYNFTDFSDDLTDLSFDHHGVFLNLTGSM